MRAGLHNFLTRSALLSTVLWLGLNITALARQDTDGHSTEDEDFVIASLLISDPGDILYSRLGHAALHMQCPEHGLDYVFTYESEDIRNNPLGFLSGKLNIGMAAIATEEYAGEHVRLGRGLREYVLNIPPESKRELWRVLDSHLMEGMGLEYDFLRYGCAHSCLMSLEECLSDRKIEFGAWPDHFKDSSRREVTWHHIHQDKWTTFLLNFIVNGQIDRLDCSNEDKTIIPADLPSILSSATIDGVPIINAAPTQLVPSGEKVKSGRLSPVLMALLLLLMTFVCAISGTAVMDYTLLAIQTVLGLITVWLVFFSSLACTEWSWLIIPFNPLPMLFWKWRHHWALPYAAILVIWSGFMYFWPHLLTDNACIIMALAFVISYINIYSKSRKGHCNE